MGERGWCEVCVKALDSFGVVAVQLIGMLQRPQKGQEATVDLLDGSGA